MWSGNPATRPRIDGEGDARGRRFSTHANTPPHIRAYEFALVLVSQTWRRFRIHAVVAALTARPDSRIRFALRINLLSSGLARSEFTALHCAGKTATYTHTHNVRASLLEFYRFYNIFPDFRPHLYCAASRTSDSNLVRAGRFLFFFIINYLAHNRVCFSTCKSRPRWEQITEGGD